MRELTKEEMKQVAGGTNVAVITPPHLVKPLKPDVDLLPIPLIKF